MRGQHGCSLDRGHQACVKADKIKATRQKLLNTVKCCIDIPQVQALVIGKLVKADTVNAAASVIPQHQTDMRSGILRKAPAKEIAQRIRFPHAGERPAVDKLTFPLGDEKAVQLIR